MAIIRAHQDQLIAMQTQHTAILSQIQQHLGILPPPEHDMPGPLESTAPSEEATPVEQTMPHEETTTAKLFYHQSNPRLRRVLWNPWQGTGHPDTPLEYCMSCGRLSFHPDNISGWSCSIEIPPGCLISGILSAAIPPECITSGMLLRRHSTQMSYIWNATPPPFHPDVSHPAHSIRIFHIRHLTPDEREGRFNFPGQAYPDRLIMFIRRVSQPFCTMPRCSPKASRYVRPTF
ncbi:hypothetical protein CK203_112621 [Vitis vinifera]|uniref:Uncharacterized protein n=1 Tax=Vitis vinifera TaxID=29760 RepID=A0A438CE53_VITVI|nr:hypothetical protein CK203_112621 [Vitis vinifera]